MYPYAADLLTLGKNAPTVTVNGKDTAPELFWSDYVGGFTGTSFKDNGETWNLAPPTDYAPYAAYLTSGSGAETDIPDLSGVPAVLYTFRCAVEDGDSHQVSVSYSCGEGTISLSWGFNGGDFDAENGLETRFGSIYNYMGTQGFIRGIGTKYLLFINGDAENFIVEDDGTVLTVERSETDLAAAIAEMCPAIYGEHEDLSGDGDLGNPGEDVFRDALTVFFDRYVLSDKNIDRYSLGMLEDVEHDIAIVPRICWAAVKATIPAGGSVTVTARYEKALAYDFYPYDTTKPMGLDLLPAAGTALDITAQRVTVANADHLEILDENFGLGNGGAVTLDPEVERYYITVRAAP